MQNRLLVATLSSVTLAALCLPVLAQPSPPPMPYSSPMVMGGGDESVTFTQDVVVTVDGKPAAGYEVEVVVNGGLRVGGGISDANGQIHITFKATPGETANLIISKFAGKEIMSKETSLPPNTPVLPGMAFTLETVPGSPTPLPSQTPAPGPSGSPQG